MSDTRLCYSCRCQKPLAAMRPAPRARMICGSCQAKLDRNMSAARQRHQATQARAHQRQYASGTNGMVDYLANL